MLLLLVLLAHQRLSPPPIPLAPLTLLPLSHPSRTRPHAPGHHVQPSVSYDPVLLDALPYATHPNDSAATVVLLRGRYPDATSFSYPLCHFSRVCTTSSHVLLQLHNYTAYAFYRRVLPYCHDRLWTTFALCQCFHYGYRPALLPFPLDVGAEGRAAGEAAGQRMAEERFGTADWARGEQPWEQTGPARDWPTLEELQTAQDYNATQADLTHPPPSLLTSLQAWWAGLFTTAGVAPRRLYRDPLSFRGWEEPPPGWASGRGARGAGNVSVVHHRAHWWSVHKWVEHHHIAHWAQKMLALYTTYSHHQRACHHSFHQQTPTRESLPPKARDGVGLGDVRLLADVHRVVREVSAGEGGEWAMECLPPVTGVLFHDTWAPPTEHESNILQITVDAINAWLSEPTPLPSSRSRRLATITSRPFPASSPRPFTAEHTVFTDALFRQYPASWSAEYPRHQPAPVNVSVLSCVDRLSFSPMYGLLTESAYDFDHWHRAAMAHFHLPVHQRHPVINLSIPRIADLPSPHLPYHPLPLAASSHIDVEPALALLECPPSRAILVTRPDRNITNKDAVLQRLLQRFNLRVDVVACDASTPSAAQAGLFASAGLVLAAHSSQLINVLFSPRGAALVEVTPELYNLDFAAYARGVGVHFRYAVGGVVQGWEDPGPKMAECMARVGECRGGDPGCMARVKEAACKEDRHFPNKHKAFEADVDAVERAVRQSLGHLFRLCYNHWGQVQITRLGG